MKICLFTSGYVRTLFYGFHKNIEVIKKQIPDSSIDIFYSFWDQNSYSNQINDPWHYKVEENKTDITQEKLNQYFYSIGFEKVLGDIESFSISEKVINESPFASHKKKLSSQYYKVYNVAKRYFSDKYDLYLTIRPDVIIQEFLSEKQINDLNYEKGIIVNENYWYNALYKGLDCNEYVWASTKDTFMSSNSQFLFLEKIIHQIRDHYGEIITGQHFRNLLSSGKIYKIETFNFDYRVVR
jgi:hypothetical protein